MKKIVACGCSITHGYFVNKDNSIRVNDSYADIFAKRNNCKIINLAKPGSSNYFITKQTEFGLTLNPDFIIVGLTSGYRFDYQENYQDSALNRTPTIHDWGYKQVSKTTYTNSTGIFNSNPIPRLNAFDHKKEFVEFLLKYVNQDIKQNQDMFIALGLIHMLSSQPVPFVIVDWTGIVDPIYVNNNIITDLKWYEMNKRFNTDADGTHFDLDGQLFASHVLETKIKENKLWNQM
jgi:hypothetical protein